MTLRSAAAALLLAVAGLAVGCVPAHAVPSGRWAPGVQVPIVPVVPVPDTLMLPGDSASLSDGRAAADSLDAEPAFRVRNLPSLPTGVPSGWSTGIWEWDRAALRVTSALNLMELFAEVPGIVPLQGGDYGQPTAVTAFAAGAGRIRIFLDGVELPALDGGAVDLSRLGLAGLESVRVERGPGALRVDLTPLRFEDPRPYSFLEVGTGDLDTNLFRGVFAHPDALGGSLVVALDRLDTEGRGAREPGVSFGGLVRHTIFLGERAGFTWDLRRMTSRRSADLWDVADVQRTDWGARVHYEFGPGIVGAIHFQRSSLVDGTDEDEGDPDETTSLNVDPRTQLGGRIGLIRPMWWADASYLQNWGSGWPTSTQVVRGGTEIADLGGVGAEIERQAWDDEDALAVHLRVWTRPLLGVSLFAELDDGRRGVARWIPPVENESELEAAETPDRFTDRTSMRAGAEYRRGEFTLGGALLTVEADTLHPVGLPPDRDGLVTVGGDRIGFEAATSLPLDRVLGGLALRGSVQAWDRDEIWRYLPERIYDARLDFHDVFMDSGNLEVWADVGVRGRDPMGVPVNAQGDAGLTTVPFRQSWFARLQIRVVSVRVFVRWENFTLRPDNQDYLERILPQTRVIYGIRWTMWN